MPMQGYDYTSFYTEFVFMYSGTKDLPLYTTLIALQVITLSCHDPGVPHTDCPTHEGQELSGPQTGGSGDIGKHLCHLF